MPWKEQSAMQERVRFVLDHAAKVYTMRELCLIYGVSRTTGYKWLSRANRGLSLADRSRRPRHSPHRTPAALEQAVIAERLKHPTWGPDKLRVILQRREPGLCWPSGTTMGQMLRRHRLIKPRRRHADRRSGRDPLWLATEAPNQVWCGDFKGEFLTGDRRYCYPLTVSDHYSRYLLGCEGLIGTAQLGVRQVFERLFREFGLPDAIVTDNGPPFSCSSALSGLSRLNVWWIRLGIMPLTIQRGHPEQNGRHERMHRTLKAETTRPPGANMADQQRRFDQFRELFNDQRPHEGLAMRMPGEVYRRSARPMPAKLPRLHYPGHYQVRAVSNKGTFHWRATHRFISQSLAGQSIGLEEVDEGVWSVYLGRVLIGRLDEPTGRITRPGVLGWTDQPRRLPGLIPAAALPASAPATEKKCPPCPR